MAQEGLFAGNVEQVQLEDEIQRSYLDYAMSVIVGRALPDVRDGLKPVHKRILWAMLEAGYRPDRPHRKCAAVIGDVLKKYHPHGDQSVYDALVRMAQDWSLRYPLVDGHGNFGSVDGDPAAAYRYCVTGDTLVRRADGSAVAIRDLVADVRPGSEADIDEKLMDRSGDPVVASRFFHSGTHDTIRITTREGYSLRGTRNHPVLCLVSVAGVPTTTWKLLDEIEPGDRAVMLRKALDIDVPDRPAPFVTGDHYFAEVSAVEDAGPAPVYSVRVDSDDHSFVTNGFVSHNTEARLAPMAMELLRDIESETVEFVPNFDGYEQQPTVLPARFPNLLVNGAGGIAVGMATNIPPHNLNEVIDGVVHYLDNPEATPSELMKFIKAPDFPTGATIMGRQGVRDAYETGRGSLKVRAVTEIEESTNGKNKIVVTELPYQVNKARLAEKIAELVKTQKIKEIADLKDESNREGMRLVIETKRGANPHVVLNQLYKHTQLQESFGIIMLALVDGIPRTLNLSEMVGYYVDHQVDVVTRRSRFDLRKAEERDHIVLGLLIALDHLDEVIKIIRASADADAARKKLMRTFTLSEIQANHILDMPLRRLTKLARTELEKEHAELLERIAYFTALLEDPVKLREVIKVELLEIKKKHGDGRRTTVRADEGDFDVEDLIAEEDVIISVSRAGYVKRLPVDAFKKQLRGGKGVRGQNLKEEDVVKHVFTTTTHHWMLFFTTKGRVYRVKAHEIPESGRIARGMYAANLPGVALDGDEKISAVIDLKEYADGQFLLFATRNGIVKKTKLPEYDSSRSGLIAVKLRGDDELIDVRLTDGDDEVFLVSRRGQAIRFKESLVRSMGRDAGGVIGMRLADDDRVLVVGLASDGEEMISVTEQGYGKRSKLADYPLKGRGGKGVIGHQLTKKTGLLAGAYVGTKDIDMFVISSSGQVVRVGAGDIRRVGRSSQGVRTMRVEEDATVVALAPVIIQMDDEE